jgi:hypothetical protein
MSQKFRVSLLPAFCILCLFACSNGNERLLTSNNSSKSETSSENADANAETIAKSIQIPKEFPAPIEVVVSGGNPMPPPVVDPVIVPPIPVIEVPPPTVPINPIPPPVANTTGKQRVCDPANRNCDYDSLWNVFFIGNSGTDELGIDNKGILPQVAQSATRKMNLWRSSSPGAPIDSLWENRERASFGEKNILLGMKNRGPLSHLVLMPIYRTSAQDTEAGGKFYREALSHSPGVQLWLYSVWGSTLNGTGPTWDADTLKISALSESTRASLDAANGGKPVRIIPGGLGFMKMRDAVVAGKIPGVSDFKAHFFKDKIHLTENGTYFMSLIYYAAWYNESPEIKLKSNGPATESQAAIYKKIAWEVVSAYPHD